MTLVLTSIATDATFASAGFAHNVRPELIALARLESSVDDSATAPLATTTTSQEAR